MMMMHDWMFMLSSYKVKHKNMFGIKSTVFIRFHFKRAQKEKKAKNEWNRIKGEDYWVVALSLRDNFYYGFWGT